MATKKTISVMGKVERILTDRTTWKSYSPEVAFDDLYVQFEISSDQAVVTPDGKIIVTLEGFSADILNVFATSMEVMHSKWEEEKAKADEKKQLEAMRLSRKKLH